MASVNFYPEFWADEFTDGLSINARYLFIYLWTSPQHNHACLYKIKPERIAFDTSLKESELDGLFAELYPKVLRDPTINLIWVVNYVKRQFLCHERIHPNMKKNIIQTVKMIGDHPFVADFFSCYPIFSEEEHE